MVNAYSTSKGDLFLGKQLDDDDVGKEIWKKGVRRKYERSNMTQCSTLPNSSSHTPALQ